MNRLLLDERAFLYRVAQGNVAMPLEEVEAAIVQILVGYQLLRMEGEQLKLTVEGLRLVNLPDTLNPGKIWYRL